MDNRSWLEKPQEIGQTNAVPALATSLKVLKKIAADYRRKGMRPKWRTTQFRNIVIVARLAKKGEKMILNDNTDILVHLPNKPPVAPTIFFRNQYYRFIFEITPYSSDSLAILCIQPVSPGEVTTHLTEIVQEDIQSQLHEQLWKNRVDDQENQETVEKVSDTKEKVLKAIAKWPNFTLSDIEQQVRCKPEQLAEVMQELGDEGKIGDMGSYFINPHISK